MVRVNESNFENTPFHLTSQRNCILKHESSQQNQIRRTKSLGTRCSVQYNSICVVPVAKFYSFFCLNNWKTERSHSTIDRNNLSSDVWWSRHAKECHQRRYFLRLSRAFKRSSRYYLIQKLFVIQQLQSKHNYRIRGRKIVITIVAMSIQFIQMSSIQNKLNNHLNMVP